MMMADEVMMKLSYDGGHDDTVKCQTRWVALFNVNSHMMAVMMIQHSKVSDEVGGAV